MGDTSDESGGPVVRLAELEIDPARLDRYEGLLREEIEASVDSEPGVLSLFAVAVKGAPGHVRIVEVYADRQAYESHLRSPHFLAYKTRTAGMIRSLTLVETDTILLRAKSRGGAG